MFVPLYISFLAANYWNKHHNIVRGERWESGGKVHLQDA